MPETLNVASPLLRKLEEVQRRYAELEGSLNDPAVLGNAQRLIAASKEKGQLESVVGRYREYRRAVEATDELRGLAADPSDAEMAALAAAELPEAERKAANLLAALKDEFVAAEDNAVDSFFLEIRAGTGGEEAALFARDLFEMYRKYCDRNGWKFEVSDLSTSDRDGFKEEIVHNRSNCS